MNKNWQRFNLVHDIKAPSPFDNLIFVKTDVAEPNLVGIFPVFLFRDY